MADIVPVPAPIPQAGVPAADQPLLDAQLPGMTPPAPGPVAAGPPVPASMILPTADVPGPPRPAPVAPQPGTTVPGTSPPVQAPVTDPLALGRQAMADQRDANADGQKAAKEEADAQQAANDAKAKLAADQAVEMQARQAEQAEQQQASDQARARLVQLADKADSGVANYKFTDWQDTVPTGKKIRLAIGAMLAGFGGSSDPLAQINKLTAQHFEQQKAELSSKEAFAGYRRQGVTDFDRHVDDQRMSLEFQERNFREAMAKEIEAQALRSGNPVVAARGAQAAAAARAEGSAKLMNSVGTYTKSREEMIRADQLARKGKGGAGGGGKVEAEGALADAASAGKPFNELVKLALKLNVKDPRKAAAEAQAGAEKDMQSVYTDPATGKKYRAPSSRGLDQVSKDNAANDAYVEAANQYADHIERFGRILNPYSDEAKRRASLAADLQSKGRAASGINSTDSGQKLEHSMIGGSGVGLDATPLSKPEVIREMAARAAEKNRKRLLSTLTPLDRAAASVGSGQEEKAPAGAIVGKMNGKRGYVLDGKFTAF